MTPSAEAQARNSEESPPFWRLMQGDPAHGVKLDAQQRDRLSISILNIEAAHGLLRHFRHEDSDIVYALPVPSDAMIPIELEIRQPGYAPDYFFETGFHFVSARFRAVADFPGDAVQYLDAPCVRCTPEAKAKDYKVLWVHRVEDVLDRERSRFQGFDGPPPYGRDEIVYLDGKTVSAPIFHLGIRPWLLLTDAAARRISRAGLDGITFWDLTRRGPGGEWFAPMVD